MNPSKLNDEMLIAILDKRVELEHENEAEMIDFIREVRRRRLWIKYGARSMFDFMTRSHYHYPRAVAQRKLDAAHAMQVYPQVKDYIVSKELNVTQLSMLMGALRQKHAKQGEITSVKKQCAIMEAMRGQTIENTQVILNEELEIQVKTRPKVRVQRDGSVRFETTFSKEEWAEIIRSKDVVSHSVPSGDVTQVLMYNTRFTLSKKDPCVSKPSPPTSASKPNNTVSSAAELTARQYKGISREAWRFVFNRDQSCRHRHPDGSFCESRYQMQIDHVVSRWKGGGNNVENLQLLCGVHNRYKYEKEISLASIWETTYAESGSWGGTQ